MPNPQPGGPGLPFVRPLPFILNDIDTLRGAYSLAGIPRHVIRARRLPYHVKGVPRQVIMTRRLPYHVKRVAQGEGFSQ
jgi:hypothetical protein